MTDHEAPPSTTLPPPLDAALGRLAAAVARLKAAGERHAAQGQPASGAKACPRQREDRGRLALDLDAALVRVARLSEAQAVALERLGRAEASIEAVLRDLADDEETEEPPIEEAS